MALSGSRLEGLLITSIKAKLVAKFSPTIPPGLSSEDQAMIEDAWQKMAEAIAEGEATKIVDEVKLGTVTTTVVGTVTTGPGAGGSVTGTSTGAIT